MASPRDSLPEDYGEGQRQYDMAMSAYRVAETMAPFVAWMVGLIVAHWLTYWSMFATWPIAYFSIMHPYKRRLKTASSAWERERESHHALHGVEQ